MGDEANGDLGGARAQCFLDRPEGFRLVARFDLSDAAGIETERIEAMAMKPAGGAEALRRGDDEDRPVVGEGGHEGGEKTQSRRQVFRRGGVDFMHRMAGQAMMREAAVESGKAQRKDGYRAAISEGRRQPAAQIINIHPAVSGRGKG